MTTAHQQFSARTRQSGELDKPDGRRRNLETGRLSVVLGSDLLCVIADDAAEDQRSAGGYIRKIVLEWYQEKHGLDTDALATRAAALRAARAAQSHEEPSPAPATPAAV